VIEVYVHLALKVAGWIFGMDLRRSPDGPILRGLGLIGKKTTCFKVFPQSAQVLGAWRFALFNKNRESYRLIQANVDDVACDGHAVPFTIDTL
jgi:hypothetical protein